MEVKRISVKARPRAGNQPEYMSQLITRRMPSPPDRNTAEFLRAYTQNPRLAPVTKISTDLASVEGKLYKIQANGKKKELLKHPFLDFLRRPNPLPWMTASAIWKCLEQYLLLKGEAVCLIERDRAGFPVELWPVPVSWVLDTPRKDYPFYLIRGRDGSQQDIPLADVFIMRQLNPVDPYGRGLGESEAVSDEIETDEYMAKWAKRFFYNNAEPSTLIAAEGANDSQLERLRASWNERYAGVANAHKVGIIGQKLTVHRLVDSQREMDFASSRKNIRDAVNAHFGIPPEIMGIVENSNRATAETAKIIYAENVLMPRLKARQDAINLQLLSAWGDDLFYEFDDIVPQDEEYKLNRSNSGLERSALTVDEWRGDNGYDPLPNGAGQVLYVPYASLPTTPEEMASGVLPTSDTSRDMMSSSFEISEKSASKRRDNYLRSRASTLSALEKEANAAVNAFFGTQNEQLFSFFESGHKSSIGDFWKRLGVGNSLMISISELRNAAREALSEFIDWLSEDKKLSKTLSPIWEKAFRKGAESAKTLINVPNVSNPQLTDNMRKHGLERVRGINETTRDKLANIIADGIEAGKSAEQLAEMIRQQLPEIQKGRARIIAISEAHTSMQAGSYQQMIYAGITSKTWITAGDEHVRQSHADIDGVTIPINERFANGLIYPGEPGMSVAETINCRCDLLPGDY